MKISSILAASLLAITAASAADLPRRSAVPANVMAPAPISNWSGFYVGGHLGLAGVSFKDNFATSATGNGLFGGAQLGYDHQFGSIVAGLAADFSLSNVRGSSVGFGSANHKYTGSLRARLGFLATNDFLIYATGGYTNTNFNASFGGFSQTSNVGGYNLGLGGEYKLNRNWSAFAEYRYTKYNQASLAAGAWLINANSNDVRLGVNYKF